MPAKKTETNDVQLQKNVRFYHRFMTTPKDAQKSFNNGSFSGTDINPMWRIMALTEVFGPTGFGWWTNNVRYDFVESPETKEVHVFCELDLYVKDPETGEVSQPIYGIGGNTYIKQWKSGAKASDEAKKMAYTDALGIACKALGIGHDIWYSNDRTKYTMYSDDQPAKPKTEPKVETKAEPKAEPKAEAKPEPHTADTAALVSEIEQKLAEYGTKIAGEITQKNPDGEAEEVKKMIRDAKVAFAKDNILPIIGGMNYKSCTDIVKLTALRDKLCA